MRIAGQLGDADLRAVELGELLLLLRGCGRLHAIGERLAQLARQRAIGLSRIAAGARRDFRRQQRRDDAVLVGGPGAAVPAQERCARALLAAESEVARHEAGDEPLEAHRHLVEPAAEPRGDPVDHGAAHDGLADRGARLPLRRGCRNR